MSKKTLDKLLSFGDQMSNVCFNLAQRQGNTENTRQTMRELCSNWDYFRRLLRAEEKSKRKAKQ